MGALTVWILLLTAYAGRARRSTALTVAQLSWECSETSDLVAAYVFDNAGYLISSEIMDVEKHSQSERRLILDVIERLRRKTELL